ncbi:MAG: hypothetical protein AB8G95_20475 [Anaerolineae bacterium]
MKHLSSEKMLVALGVIWLIFGAGVYASSIFRPAPVTITWSTETEFDTAGFNIYRSDTLDGEYQQVNEQLLPGSAEAAAGASYTWIDKSAEPGRSYFYQLEDVEYSNNRTQHAPFEHRATGITPTKLVISISGLLLGLALIFYGSFELKRKNRKLVPSGQADVSSRP